MIERPWLNTSPPRPRNGYMRIQSADGRTVLKANDRADYGIYGHNCNLSKIAGFDIEGALAAGIWVHMGEGSRVTDCEVSKSAVGLYSDGSNASAFDHLHLLQNRIAGAYITNANPGNGGCSMRNCMVQLNEGHGIHVKIDPSGQAQLRDNSFEQNRGHGIYIERGHAVITGGTIKGANASGHQAIYIGPGCTSALIEGVNLAASDGGYHGYARIMVAESVQSRVVVKNCRLSSKGLLIEPTIVMGI